MPDLYREQGIYWVPTGCRRVRPTIAPKGILEPLAIELFAPYKTSLDLNHSGFKIDAILKQNRPQTPAV